MASSTDNTDGGQFDDGNDGSLYGNPTGNGSVEDYSTYTWQQIEAAILGGSMLATTDDQSQARSTADPSTLWTAAETFNDVMSLLSDIAQGLQTNATSLAGPDSVWQGDAANSFSTMITSFSGQVLAAANVLAGGPSGLDSIPEQLNQNGNALSVAQSDIEDIDTYYAQAAINEGAPIMSNGLVQISAKPVLVEEMLHQMQQVFQSLYTNYQFTVDSIVAPSSVNNPLGDDNLNTGNLGDDNLNNLLNNLGDGAVAPDAMSNLPNSADTGDGDGIGADDLSNLPNAADSGDGIGADNLSDLPDSAGTDDGVGADNLSDLPNSADTGDGDGIGADDLASLPGTSGDDGGVSPDGLSNLGDTEGGVDDDAVSPAGLSNLADTDGLGDDGVSPDTGLPDISDSGVPDGVGDDALASVPTGLSGLGDGQGTGLPGLDDSAVPTQAESGDEMPMMPGMGSGGLSGAGTGTEPSDASGLLSDGAAPWTAHDADSGSDADEVGSPFGTSAGGAGLSGLSGLSDGDEMPMMPGMGGGGLSGAGSGTEPSDASGLLSEGEEPWTAHDADSGSEADEVGSPSGAAAGGAGLSGLSDGDEMPMMPGMGGGAVSGAVAGMESSDASGLLGEEAEEWSGEPEPVEEVGSELGAGRGGPGLDWSAEPDSPDPGPDGDLSGWDTAGAVGDGLLLALGLWSQRTADPDGESELGEQTVSTARRETWTGPVAADGAGSQDDEDVAAAVWRPDRSAAPSPRRRLSLAPEPAADEEGAEPPGHEPDGDGDPDDDAEGPVTAADLLVQEAQLWGRTPSDWDEL